jgi:AraC-like DNA-binding protein
MEHLHVDLSVSALVTRFSVEEGVLLPAFQSHTGIALDQFVLRRRIERALHLLKNSDASDSEIAAGIGWGRAPAFQAAFLNYQGSRHASIEEVCRRNSRRRVARAQAPVQVCLLTTGRISWTGASGTRSPVTKEDIFMKRCGHTTARKEAP